VLVVGDSLEDVEWGFLAGCQTCLIDIGASHYDSTIKSGYAHYTIKGLAELKGIMNRSDEALPISSSSSSSS